MSNVWDTWITTSCVLFLLLVTKRLYNRFKGNLDGLLFVGYPFLVGISFLVPLGIAILYNDFKEDKSTDVI